MSSSASANLPQKTSFEDISVIHAFAQICATILDLDDLLKTSLEILSQTFEYDLYTILFVNSETEALVLKTYQTDLPFEQTEDLLELIFETVHLSSVINRDPLQLGVSLSESHSRYLAFPLTIGRLVIGALVVANQNALQVPPHQEQILSIFASQMTVAITNAQRYGKLTEQKQQEFIRRQVASHLQKLSTVINATLNLNDVLALVLDHIKNVIPYDNALIALLSEQNLIVRAVVGASSQEIPLGTRWRASSGGLIYSVLSHQYPSIFHDITKNTIWLLDLPTELRNSKACIGAPLIIKEQVLGVMTLHHQEAGYFDNADLDLVSTFANQAAIAIENAQIYQREQHKVKQFQTVAKIGRQATEARNIRQLLNTVIERLHFDLNYEFVTMLLYQPQTNSLRVTAANDLTHAEISSLNRAIPLEQEGVISSAGRTRQPLLVNDVSTFKGYFAPSHRPDVQSELAIPLTTRGRLVGLLDIQSNNLQAFQPDDVILAQMVADQLAIAIVTVSRFEKDDWLGNPLPQLADYIPDTARFLEILNETIRQALTCMVTGFILFEEADPILTLFAGPLSAVDEDLILHLVNQKPHLSETIRFSNRAEFNLSTQQFSAKIESLLILPFSIGNSRSGFFVACHNCPYAFDNTEARLLTIIISQVVLVVKNFQRLRPLQATQPTEDVRSQLEQFEQRQNEFLENISHELKTPLTFIRAYVDLILEESLGPISSEVMEGLEIVSRRSEDLDRLLNDIITYRHLQMDNLTVKTVDLTHLIHTIIKSAKPLADKFGVKLAAKIPTLLPTIEADPTRLSQVFDNLINNAIKFTPEKGQITVTVKSDDESMIITVADTGVGIAQSELDKIFDRFYQVDSAYIPAIKGSGLGLTIVKKIIEAHQGQISVKSELGQGTKFTFTMPIASTIT